MHLKLTRNKSVFMSSWKFSTYRIWDTVNSEIFAKVLFSRNFTDAKFRENKTSRKGQITLSLTGVGKSCPSREFWMYKMRLLALFAKMSNLQLDVHAGETRGVRVLKFGLSLYLYSYDFYASSKDSGEPVHLHRLAFALAARRCDKYHNRV